MALPKIFDRFVDESPVSVMWRAILEYSLPTAVIDEVFVREARVQRQDRLLFSTTVDVLSLAVCNVRDSVRAAHQAEKVEVSVTSLYEKLKGTETRVSEALVRESARRLTPVVQSLSTRQAPLKGLRLKIIDGNHLAATEKRLAEARTRNSRPLPGLSVVVLDYSLRMVTDVFLIEDAYSQERSVLTEGVLPTVEPNDCWMGDRNFCTMGFLFGIADRSATFLIREHASTARGKKLQGKRKSAGRCKTGDVFEQTCELSQAKTKATLTVRRITIVRDKPTSKGEKEIHLLTNIPVETANASQLAALYQERWTIENVFQELEQVLRSEVNTLCYPKAALFAFSIALYLYNDLSAMKMALHAAHGDAAELAKLSGYYLAEEISAIYGGMLIAIPEATWTAEFGSLTDCEFASELRELAKRVPIKRFLKSSRGPKKPPPKRTGGMREKHVSSARLIASRK